MRRHSVVCDASTAEEQDQANTIDTDAALGALLLLLLRFQRRLWKPAKEDLIRRLSEPGVVPASYTAIAQSWAIYWSGVYRTALPRVYDAVGPALGRLVRVTSTQVDRQLVAAGYQAQAAAELPAVVARVRQVQNQAAQATVTQTTKMLETVAATLQQAALTDLPTENLVSKIADIAPPKRSAQWTGRLSEGAIIAATQRAAFLAAGVERAVWVSRRDDRVRPKHRRFDGQTYDVATGLEGVHPRQEEGCRCDAVPVPKR